MEHRRPIITLTLVALNIAGYAAMVATSGSLVTITNGTTLDVGAIGTLVVFRGEWWRLLVSAFAHTSVAHLGITMFSLLGIGRSIEAMVPGRFFLLVYFLTAAAASVVQVMVNPLQPLMGAGGAVFGLFGFFVGFVVRGGSRLGPGIAQSLWTSIGLTIGINVVLVLLVPGLAIVPVLGSGAVGVFAGVRATAEAIEREEPLGARLSSQIVVVAAVIGMAILASVRTSNSQTARAAYLADQAFDAFVSANSNEVERLSSESLAESRNARSFALRGIARMTLGNTDGGLQDLDTAVATLDRETAARLLAIVHETRARHRLHLGEFREADADLHQAELLWPGRPRNGERSVARLRLGDLDGGVSNAQVLFADRASGAVALNNTAWALLHSGADLDLALALANRALGLAPSGYAKSTRCWIRTARGEPELALPDCVAAVESGGELMDRGMVAYLQQNPEEALVRWEEAATKSAVDARDLAPWIARARAQLSGDDAGVP
jgi:membrane associated rhomboid family serine protease